MDEWNENVKTILELVLSLRSECRYCEEVLADTGVQASLMREWNLTFSWVKEKGPQNAKKYQEADRILIPCDNRKSDGNNDIKKNNNNKMYISLDIYLELYMHYLIDPDNILRNYMVSQLLLSPLLFHLLYKWGNGEFIQIEKIA